MSELKKLQQQFLSFLQDHSNEISDQIVAKDEQDNQVRLNIYRYAYRKRLQDTIDNDHPILGTYLGDDWFNRLVEEYLKLYPSKVISLRHFCNSLPDFLASTEPFNEHPIMAEIALFERLLLSAFDAAEEKPIELSDLQMISPEYWPNLKIQFQPSVNILETQWNSVESWQAIKAEKTPSVATQQRNSWLLWRNSERLTEFRSLAADENYMFNCFLEKNNFSTVCEGLQQWHDDETISLKAINYLTNWITQGLIIKLDLE